MTMYSPFKQYVTRQITSYFSEIAPEFSTVSSGRVQGGETWRWKPSKSVQSLAYLTFERDRDRFSIYAGWSLSGRLPAFLDIEGRITMWLINHDHDLRRLESEVDQAVFRASEIGEIPSDFEPDPWGPSRELQIAEYQSVQAQRTLAEFNEGGSWNDRWKTHSWDTFFHRIGRDATEEECNRALSKPLATARRLIALQLVPYLRDFAARRAKA